MAVTQIEWTDATWNPVVGCSIVSAGCTNCYAMEMAQRLDAMGVDKYQGLTRRSGKRAIWRGVVRENHAALEIPLRWKRPKKIFVNSMSDLDQSELRQKGLVVLRQPELATRRRRVAHRAPSCAVFSIVLNFSTPCLARSTTWSSSIF
jgi:protein gp37